MPDSDNQSPETSSHQCQAVAVKLPPFWPDNIDAWFSQVESQFRIKGVTTQQTKFDYVVQAMSQSEVVKVLDLVRNLPNTNPYSTLKDNLTSLFAMTEYARYEAFINLPMSGDMLPTTLMSKMLALLPEDHKPCWFLRSAFLHRLPADIRCHLVDEVTEDPLKLALRADRLFKSRLVAPSIVNTISDHPETIYAVCQPARSVNSHHSSTPVPASAGQQHPDPCPAVLSPQIVYAGIIAIMQSWLRNVKPHAPGRKTSCPAGRHTFSSCRFLQFFPDLPP